MTIWVNQKAHTVEQMTIQQLIDHLNIKTQGIAIAVNNQVITRSEWTHFTIKENDNILIIRATQGG